MARAVVIGAGVGGLAAGAALQRRGWDVSVLERSGALEAVGAGLALAPNALKALDVLGVGDQVRAQSALQGAAGIVRTDGRWISRIDAATAEARYGGPTVVLHRAALVDLLAGGLRPGTLQLGTQVSGVDAESGTVCTEHGDTKADLVVAAANGINSSVRRALFPAYPDPVYAGVTSWRIVVPAPAGPVLPVETWGRGLVFGMTILGDGRVYCYATAVAAPGGSAPDEKAELRRHFGTWHASIPQLIDAADRVPRTTAVAAASRRIGRLTRLSNPAAVFLRDTAMHLAGRLGPNVVLKQMDPVLGWRPPGG